MNRAVLAIVALVASVLGGVVGARLERQHADDEMRVMAALQATVSAGLCANALRTLDEGRLDRQRRLLENQMQGFVEWADRDLEGVRGSTIGPPIPNLIDAVMRARQYAESKGNRDLVDRCDHLVAALKRGARA